PCPVPQPRAARCSMTASVWIPSATTLSSRLRARGQLREVLDRCVARAEVVDRYKELELCKQIRTSEPIRPAPPRPRPRSGARSAILDADARARTEGQPGGSARAGGAACGDRARSAGTAGRHTRG